MSFNSSKPISAWGPSHDTFRDHMIGVLLQPSLSATNHDGTPCSSASAFLLQTLPQSRIMVGFGNNALPRMERMLSPGGSGDCEIAHAHIYPNHVGMAFGWRIGYFHVQ